MKKCYIVLNVDWEDNSVLAVFETEEGAHNFLTEAGYVKESARFYRHPSNDCAAIDEEELLP